MRGAALFAVAALAVAGWLHLHTQKVAETDVFYHFSPYAVQYAREGPFASVMPRLAYSPLGKIPGDFWYGFHLFLAPFTLLQDPLLRIKAAGIAALAILLITTYLVFRRSRMLVPWLWPFVMLFSSGLITWRFTMVRPHVLSVALAMVLFSFMAEGSLWAVFAVSAAIGFVHLAYSWLPLVVAVTMAPVIRSVHGAWPWQRLALVVGGLAAGWVLRPHPIGTLHLLYVQVFRLMLESGPGHIRSADEVTPILGSGSYVLSLSFLIAWLVLLAGVVIAIGLRRLRLSGRDGIVFWGSLALSVIFYTMAVRVAVLFVDQWAPFATLFIACSVTQLLRSSSQPVGLASATIRRVLLVGGAAMVAGMVIFSLSGYNRTISAEFVQPDRL